MNKKLEKSWKNPAAGEAGVKVVPAARFDAGESSAGAPDGVRRESAAPASGEALPTAPDHLQKPAAREHKRAMGLIRKETTSAMGEANRANSLKCTGPVTDIGKINASLNAVKHGILAYGGLAREELGEDPFRMQEMYNHLKTCFRPRDRFELLLLNQMVENRWRRQRAVRAETSLLAAQRLNFDLEYGRKLAGEGRSRDSAGEARAAAASGLVALPDSSVKFNLILQCLRAAQEAVGREGFGEEGLKQLEAVYGPDPGLAGAVLLAGYHQCREEASGRTKEAAPDASGRHAFMESLMAEVACFEKLLELHEAAAESLAVVSAGAQHALSGSDSQRFTRYEAFLDRQFERLVKQFTEWRASHSDATSFIYGTDAEKEDAETLTQKIRAAAIARDEALTRAMKAAWGKDFMRGSSGTEGRPARGRPKEKT
jgi:hypothetical protein